MRRLISVVLIICTLVCLIVSNSTFAYIGGDVNLDGKVNSIDLNMMLKIMLGGNGTNISKRIADINGDGKVNAIDSSLLRQIFLGQYSAIEIEPNDYILVENGKLLLTNVTYVEKYENTKLKTYLSTLIRTFNSAISGVGVTSSVKVASAKSYSYNADTHEIIVGYVSSCPESVSAYNEIPADSYGIVRKGNKIVLVYRNEYQLWQVYNEFSQAFSAIEINSRKSVLPETLFEASEHNNSYDFFPVYNTEKEQGFTQITDTSFEYIWFDVSLTDLNDYKEIIIKRGYSLQSENTIDTAVTQYTLSNGSYDVTLYYTSKSKEMRVVVDSDITPSITSVTSYEKVCEPQITMLGVDYTSADGKEYANGLSMLIRLEDGKFIVIDGAHNYKPIANKLIDVLREQSAAYLSDGEQPTITAWVITHTHSDHAGILTKKYSMIKNAGITVENILFSPTSGYEILNAVDIYESENDFLTVDHMPQNEYDNSRTRIALIYEAANALGANIIYPHTGDSYSFAGCLCEVLFTTDLYAPRILNAYNSTSIIMKFTIAGTTFLSVGDTSGRALSYVCDLYGEYICCDIMNTIHHGLDAAFNLTGARDSYKAIKPSLVLWDASRRSEEYAELGYIASVQYWQKVAYNPNFKEQYVAGSVGDEVIIPLPYTPGNVIVKRVDN